MPDKMLAEPLARQGRNLFERSGLLEQMRRARNDREALGAAQFRIGGTVQIQDDLVIATVPGSPRPPLVSEERWRWDSDLWADSAIRVVIEPYVPVGA